MIRFILILFFIFQYFGLKSQTIQSGMSWLTTNPVTNTISPNYPTTNCGNINYSINCSKPFKRSNNGAPYNNNCLIFPSDISITNTFVTMTITFNQPVSNLKIRFIDLDENVSGFTQPEESISQINPPASSVTPLNLAVNPFYLVGGVVTPFDNISNNNNNDASGWVNWNGTLSSVSLRYNRPGSAYALIIDSIYFDCPSICSLIADAGQDFTICNSIPQTINAENPDATNYLWNTGATTSSINVSNAGIYWVEITDGICTDIDSVVVSNEITPSVFLGNDTSICNSQLLTLNASSSSGNYLWSNNATTPTITPNQSGSYWVQVTNSCGSDADTITLTLEIPPILNLGNDSSICINTQITLNPAISNVSYTWQDNSTDSTYVVNQAGNYWVTVTSENCIVSDTIQIDVISPPTVSVPADTTICNNINFVLNPLINGTYTNLIWNNNSTAVNQTVTASGTYWVEVENICGIDRDSISIIVDEIPILNLGNDTTICSNTSLILSPNILNANYTWQNNSTTPTFLVNQNGTYWVEAVSGVCIVSDTIQISILNSPTIELGNDTTVCEVYTTLLTPIIINSYDNLVWNNNSNAISQIANSTGIYWVEVENSCGIDRDSISIIIETAPSVNLGNDTAICANTAISLNPGGTNSTYLWQDNSINSTYLVNQAGIYWVDVTQGSCLVRDSIVISVQEVPVVDLGNDSTVCIGSSVLLNANNLGASYLWQNGSTLQNLTINQDGTYWVNVSNQCGTASDTFNLTIQNQPSINFSSDTLICFGETIILNAEFPDANYLWQDNSTNSTLAVSQAGIYSVIVFSGVCQLNHEFLINTKLCNTEIEMPSIFTPNGDGTNDFFIPVTYQKVKSANLIIVNRWGNVIYNESNLLSGWDGTSNGKECTEGVYFWKIEYEDFNSSKFTEYGYIHLEK
jgi:gliding motility-associated-like protein